MNIYENMLSKYAALEERQNDMDNARDLEKSVHKSIDDKYRSRRLGGGLLTAGFTGARRGLRASAGGKKFGLRGVAATLGSGAVGHAATSAVTSPAKNKEKRRATQSVYEQALQ